MMSDDHERFSELLAPYLKGELAAPEAAEVDAHLTSCSECRGERAGLAALLAAEPAHLTDAERASLADAVAAAASVQAGRSHGRGSTARAARLGRALGVAASIALLVGGLAYVGLQGGEDAGTGAASGVAAEDEGGEEAGGLEDADQAKPKRARKEAVTSAGQAAEGAAGATADELAAVPPEPRFDASAGRITRRKLVELGRDGALFRSFTRSFDVADARRLRQDYVERLVRAAPESAAEAVTECSEIVFAGEGDNALTTYGAVGTEAGEPVLVLGFAFSGEEAGPLDRKSVV